MLDLLEAHEEQVDPATVKTIPQHQHDAHDQDARQGNESCQPAGAKWLDRAIGKVLTTPGPAGSTGDGCTQHGRWLTNEVHFRLL